MARVLIVDDSVIIRKNLQNLFSQLGHTVVAEAVDGKEAVEAYNKYMPDLVTMDITMPVMDGIEAVRRITIDHKDAHIIMVSAQGQKLMVLEAMKNGARNFIVKPIRLDTLKRIVDQITSNENEQSTDGSSAGQTDIPDSDEAVSSDSGDTHDKTVQQKENLFDIKNNEGVFDIKIFGNLDTAGITSLKSAVSGLLFVKPLKAVLDCESVSDLAGSTIDTLQEVVKNIKEAGGTITVTSNTKKLIQM
ncbi:response regulator [candidate division KSB1 bacterium]